MNVAPMNEPYIYVRRVADVFQTQGFSSFTFGHNIGTGTDEMPDGVFVEWAWDGDGVVLRNDRFGCYPIFYSAKVNEFAVLSSLLGSGKILRSCRI